MAQTKVNEKYGQFGLDKTEGVTTFHGKGVNDVPDTAKTFLMNYGMFVVMTRELAAPKDAPLTDDEKQAKLDACWQWLMDGCPKSDRDTSFGKKARLTADIAEATARLTAYAGILPTLKGTAKAGIEALFAKDWTNLAALQTALSKLKA
jgi:hypothetical protein